MLGTTTKKDTVHAAPAAAIAEAERRVQREPIDLEIGYSARNLAEFG